MSTGNIQGRISIAGAENAQAKLRETGRSAGDLSKSLGPTAGGLAKNIAAMGTGAGLAELAVQALKASIDLAIQSARAAAVALYELAQRAGEVAPAAAAFERIGDPALLARLQNMTRGLVSNQRLMTEFTQAARAGMLDQEEIARAFALVTSASTAMGRSVDESIQRLGTALSAGQLEGFAEFGVNIGQIRTALTDMGLSAESGEGRVQGLRMAMRQMQEDAPDLGGELDNTGAGIQRMTVALENARDTMALTLGTNQQLAGEITRLGASVESLSPRFAQLGVIIAEEVNIAFDYLVPILREVETAIGDTSHTISRLFQETLQGGDRVLAQRARQQESEARFAAETSDLGPRGSAIFHAVAGAASAAPRRRAGGGAGGRARAVEGPASMNLGDLIPGLEAAAESSRARQLAGRQKALQDEIDLERERVELAEQLTLIRQKQADDDQIALETAAERADLEKEAVEAAAAYAEQQREIALGTAEAVAGAFGTLAQITGQIIAQQEAAGESAEVLKAVQGGFLIAYNAVMAATEIARAIASAASLDPIGTIGHAASAAAHVAAAVMAATQLGGGSAAAASAAASKPTSTFHAAESMTAPRSQDRGVTIHQQYLLSDSESGLARTLERAEWQRRRQYRPSRSAAVRYGA